MSAATQPAGDDPAGIPASSERKSTVPLETLVSNQLSGRRKMHLDSGWEAFRRADYQAACREFSLADGYSSTSLADQAEVRVALVYARVALQQFTEAGGAMKWLLQNGLRRKVGDDRSFASLVPDLPSCYARRSELDSHLSSLRAYTARCEAALRTAGDNSSAPRDVARLKEALTESKALRLIIEYAIPEARAQALFDVDSFANAPEPWNNFGKLLRGNGSESSEASPQGGVPASRPAVEFPFNLFQEAPPQALMSPPPSAR